MLVKIRKFIDKAWILKDKSLYFLAVLFKRIKGIDYTCPNCGFKESRPVIRKYFVLELRRCNNCFLMYRVPKQDYDENRMFYENRYKECGLTTGLPSKEELAYLLKTNFKDSEKDFSGYIKAVKSKKEKGSLLDFGANWGYGVWQFNKEGFKAVGYEISKTRTEFGRKRLGVDIIDSFDELKEIGDGSFDIIFSSHVFEHLPSVNDYLTLFHRLLKEKGIIVIVAPNCNGMDDKNIAVLKKSYAFGIKHNFALDDIFWRHNLPRLNFEILDLTEEAMVIAQKA